MGPSYKIAAPRKEVREGGRSSRTSSRLRSSGLWPEPPPKTTAIQRSSSRAPTSLARPVTISELYSGAWTARPKHRVDGLCAGHPCRSLVPGRFFSSGCGAKVVMSDPAADLVVPTIVLVEAGFLYAKKRTSVDA